MLNLDNKEWKDLTIFENKDFTGRYKISNTGEVYSMSQNKIMKPVLGGNGYLKIGLRDGITKYRIILHRLVASYFILNPFNKNQVNHIDGNKLNNNACNLEWCTAKENTAHAIKTGLRKPTDHNKGKKLGKTSHYHYVEFIMMKETPTYRTVVKKGSFHKARSFSVLKHGSLEAERLAAIAANELIHKYKEFNGLALNTVI